MTCERCGVRRARWRVTITGRTVALTWRRCTPCLEHVPDTLTIPQVHVVTITRLGQSGE